MRYIGLEICNSVGEILDCFSEKKEWFSDSKIARYWIGTNERIVARLYFETYLKSHNLVEYIFKNSVDDEFEINIITTSFGATGSGILWNLILLIKEYFCKNKNASHRINIFVILPEIVENIISVNTQKNWHKIRTYAFLREMYTFWANDDHCASIISNMIGDTLPKENKHLIDNILFYDKKTDNYDEIIKDVACWIRNTIQSVAEERTAISKIIQTISQEYKTAYDKCICELNADNQITITPHIDNNWHIALPGIPSN